MKSERWRQVDELFERALERAPEERAAFLDAACAADPSLRREVEEMLRFYERADYGFRVSLSGRSLFRGGLLED